MDGLSELPVIGPMFQGGGGAVGLRIVMLLAVVAGGVYAIRYLFLRSKRPGAPSQSTAPSKASPRALAKEGRFVEAGDAALAKGELKVAMLFYEQGCSWAKAGTAARKAGDNLKAGQLFEKAKDAKLAFACYEAAGKMDEAMRVAAESTEPSLLAKLAQKWAEKGQPLHAAGWYRKAGMIADAERWYLKVPGEGTVKAAQMYLEAYKAAQKEDLFGTKPKALAKRSADLFLAAGKEQEAHEVLVAAGMRRPTDKAPLRASEEEPLDIGTGASPLPSTPGPAAGGGTAWHEDQTVDIGEDFCLDALLAPAAGGGDDAAACGGYEEGTNPTIDSFVAEVTERYEILEELGRGGMGRVYKAKDQVLGRTVALKFLNPVMMADKRAVDLFQQEARAAAGLSHPCIVTIFDVGLLAGRLFIAMELVEGASLSDILNASGPMVPARAFDVAIQLADAIQYAHEQGVIHRDLKPANVMVTRSWTPKLLDFGLAGVAQDEGDPGRTGAGTPKFMAPEQLVGAESDARTDVFGLGILCYCIFTASPPFKSAERNVAVPPPSTVVNWIPTAVDDVVMKAMALQPNDRFQTAGQLAEALRAIKARAGGGHGGVVEVVKE